MALLAHSRLIISGKIGPSQTWSTGIGLAGSELVPPDAVKLQTVVDTAAPLVATWWGAGPNALNGVDVTIDKITCTSYAAGATKASAVAEHQYASTLTGEFANQALPTYVSMVASLRSNTPGRSGRGRMYLPACTAVLELHQFTLTQCRDTANATSALLRALTALEPTFFTPSVCGKFGNYPITSVHVDSLPDVQHRREDKIGALFTNIAVV